MTRSSITVLPITGTTSVHETGHPDLEKEEERQVVVKLQPKVQFRMYTDDITEEWSIRRVATERYPIGWEAPFLSLGSTFDHIEQIIQEKAPGRIVPLKKDLFRAFHLCPLSRVKVVIIGQDPYYTINEHGLPDATGLAFSTWKDSRTRDSVQNIFIEVKTSYPSFKIPNHSDLSKWAEQGVLLLNSSLTTIAGEDKAHPFIWMSLITAVIDQIKENAPHTVVLMWGKEAQKLIPRLGKLRYLVAAHPSNRSVHGGFFGCGHFLETNRLLVQTNKSPIDWTLLE